MSSSDPAVVLVAYGSSHGGTEEVAQTIARELVGLGHAAEVFDAGEVDDVEPYDAVVVGGAVYVGRWHRRARRFVERHLDELQDLPVFLFSTGPLEKVVPGGEPEPAGFRRLAKKVGALDAVEFGGVLREESAGLLGRQLIKEGKGGDWRDQDAIQAWARTIASRVGSPRPARPPPATPRRRRARRVARNLLGALCALTAAVGIVSGVRLMWSPRGGNGVPSVDAVGVAPFLDYWGPGFILSMLGFVGALAAVGTLRREAYGAWLATATGVALSLWLVVQVGWLPLLDPLHWIYFAAAPVLVLTGWWLVTDQRRARRRMVRARSSR